MSDDFELTCSRVAALAGCGENLVREYADAGLLESRRLSNGMRVFRPDAAERVRQIKAERLARRGRYQRQMAAG